MRNKIFFSFLFLICSFKAIQSSKLNYPRVLLPIFDKISISFTLEVIEKGCFKWTSSRNDLIQILPQYENNDNDCSSKAIVKVLTKEPRRNTAIVLAEDLDSGEILRCDVILDVIHEFGVLTTTRELYLEEAPETFEIWAQDSQGNAFTTLEGVEFQWEIVQPDNSWPEVLRFSTFSESKYHEIPSQLAKFESLGIRGYMVLLEAINTGIAKVSVKLPYPEYENVSLLSVEIMVLANIILDPTDAHILVGDKINFRILQLKQGKQHEISLNNQYYLEVLNNRVVMINKKEAKGISLGTTTVVLRDRNVLNDCQLDPNNMLQSPVPRATITVSSPYKMTINLLPYYNWITVEGEQHEIAIDLYTDDDQQILLGPVFTLKSSFNDSIFYPLRMNKNGTRIFGQTLKDGSCIVHASFKKFSAKAELQVFKELSITPKIVMLPFDPNSPKSQNIQFTAHGGDGSFIWSTQNPNIVNINQNGFAEIDFDPDGRLSIQDAYGEKTKSNLSHQANVKVSMSRNQKIFRFADILLLPPAKLEIGKYNMETALHDYVKIQLVLYAYFNESFVPFTICNSLIFEFEFSNRIFQVDSLGAQHSSDKLDANACHILYLKSTQVGRTNLKIVYRIMDKILSDEVQLNVFEPLTLVSPEQNEIILPIGGSRNMIYMHGPQRVFNLETELIKEIQYDKKIVTIVEHEAERAMSIYILNVLCLAVGETSLELNIFNLPASTNCLPYITTLKTNIYCVKPRYIHLYSTETISEDCPLESVNSIAHVTRKNEKVKVEIKVLDIKNRQLMNISSLSIAFGMIAHNNTHIRDSFFARHVEEKFIEEIEVPYKDYVTTALPHGLNIFKVRANVAKYDTHILKKHKIKPENPEFGIVNPKTGKLQKPTIENEINFVAVNNTLFTVGSIKILLSKDREERFHIDQGSGYYKVEVSDDSIVNAKFDSTKKDLIIKPLKIGQVIIELSDRCMISEPAKLVVSVVSVRRIHVEALDRVEKSQILEAIITLYDSDGEPLFIDPFNMQNYELSENIFDPNILGVKLSKLQLDMKIGEIRYLITGNEIGETKIIFNSGTGENLVSSQPITVQVFPRLKLHPRNATIIIGSVIHISYEGGPKPSVNIHYDIRDHKVATVDSGLMRGLTVGNTTITGKCIGVDSKGNKIVYSEDTIKVHVVILEGIQIRTPLVRIKAGAVMPAYVWGVPDLPPMILGTIEYSKILWSTKHPDVVDIYNVFADIGIEYNEVDLITVRIKALNPGKAKVNVQFSLSSDRTFYATVEIIVFKTLELVSPIPIRTDTVLMSPRSTIQLKSNLNDVQYKFEKPAKVQFNLSDKDTGAAVAKTSPSSSKTILKNKNPQVIHVSIDGIVKSGDALGQEVVTANTFEQTLRIDVEVKNIQYILISVFEPSVKLKVIEDKIPRGMNLRLKITLHDNLGNEFAHDIEDSRGINFVFSHRNILNVLTGVNQTFAINAPRRARTMLGVTLKDTSGVKYAADYIKIVVRESKYSYPKKSTFAVGDIICFESPLTSETVWVASDDSAIKIHPTTGVSRIISSQIKSDVLEVTHRGLSQNTFKFDLQIKEADYIKFDKDYDVLIGKSYAAYLITKHHTQTNKTSNLFSRNVTNCESGLNFLPTGADDLFSCTLSSKTYSGSEILKFYKAKPKFDIEKMTYLCEIKLLTEIMDILNIIDTNNVIIELTARLLNGVSDTISLKVVPGITVSPESITVDQIHRQGITIIGLEKILQNIEISSSDEEILSIIPQAKSHGTLHYKLKLLDEIPPDQPVYVRIVSPFTLQNFEIPIKASKTVIQTCSTQPFMTTPLFLMNVISNLGFIISIIVFVATIVWFFMFGFPGRSRTAINNAVFQKSPKSAKTNDITGASFDQSFQNNSIGNISGGSPGRMYYNQYDGRDLNLTSELRHYGESPERRVYRRVL